MAELVVQSLCLEADGARLVDDVSLSVRGGELVAIIGENGAGKSNLMRAMAGYAAPSSGQVMVDGRHVGAMAAQERARRIGWLPQEMPLAWPVEVRNAVAVGRFVHGGLPGRLSAADSHVVERVLAECDLEALANRSTAHLSGGEIARVHLARTMVGEALVFLADEPVAALDPRHRLAVMGLFRALADRGTAVAMVLHDLTLAARFADRIIGMKAGRVLVDGPPVEVVTREWIAELFGVEAEVDVSRGWPVPVVIG
jgi:iron complex transport system ATP-binding protein